MGIDCLREVYTPDIESCIESTLSSSVWGATSDENELFAESWVLLLGHFLSGDAVPDVLPLEDREDLFWRLFTYACRTWQLCLHNGEACGFVTFLCVSVATHVTARDVCVIIVSSLALKLLVLQVNVNGEALLL